MFQHQQQQTCAVCDKQGILTDLGTCTSCTFVLKVESERGFRELVAYLERRGEFIDWCIAHGKPCPYPA